MPVLIGSSVIVIGWFVNSFLDRKKKRRHEITKYLITAYTDIEDSSERKTSDPERIKKIEKAFAAIQLLGTPKMFELIDNFGAEFANPKEDGSRQADMKHILIELRTELRKELSLKKLKGPRGFRHLRM